MASLEVQEAVAPHTKRWQTVRPRGSYSRRVRDELLRNHPRDHQSFNRYSLLTSSFFLSGLCHSIKEKDEDGDMVAETMGRTLARSPSTRVQP